MAVVEVIVPPLIRHLRKMQVQSEDRSLAQPRNIVETTDGLIGEFGSEELDLESSFDP